jgi:hypothetical protein
MYKKFEQEQVKQYYTQKSIKALPGKPLFDM